MRKTRRMRRMSLITLNATLFVCFALTSCSAATNDNSQGDLERSVENVPEFTGPWAQNFNTSYSTAPNDEIREYLRDESVSDLEAQAVTDDFRTCLATQGVTFEGFTDDGAYDFEFTTGLTPNTATTITDDCANQTGVDAIIGLYYQIQANPQNTDMSAEIASCLVRSAAVPSDFTEQDYKAAPIQEFALTAEQDAIAAVQACESDPLGAFND